MNPLRVAVSFPVTDAPDDLEPAIGVFHRFIQRGLVEGFVLDVADYRHVPTGPGVLLVGHDVDYGVGQDEFLAVRKRSQADDAATQFRDALRMGLGAFAAIEDDGALDVSIDRSVFTVAVHDRSLGPSDEVAGALRSELEPVVAELCGDAASVAAVEHEDPRRAPTLRVELDEETAAGLLETLGGHRAPGQSPWDISVEELARLREAEDEDFVLLDVRDASEYEIVNLGGRHAPLASLGDHLDGIDRGTRVVAHCRAGHRGAKAVAQLREAGFEDAWNVNGGLIAWIDRIDPSLQRY